MSASHVFCDVEGTGILFCRAMTGCDPGSCPSLPKLDTLSLRLVRERLSRSFSKEPRLDPDAAASDAGYESRVSDRPLVRDGSLAPAGNCAWMAAIVLRTNCLLDIREVSSATCRSVLSKRREYTVAWTMSKPGKTHQGVITKSYLSCQTPRPGCPANTCG
jgi:hypothetical protein